MFLETLAFCRCFAVKSAACCGLAIAREGHRFDDSISFYQYKFFAILKIHTLAFFDQHRGRACCETTDVGFVRIKRFFWIECNHFWASLSIDAEHRDSAFGAGLINVGGINTDPSKRPVSHLYV